MKKLKSKDIIGLLFILSMISFIFSPFRENSIFLNKIKTNTNVTYSEFKKEVENNNVTEITINKNKGNIIAKLNDGNLITTLDPEWDEAKALIFNSNIPVKEIKPSSFSLWELLLTILPVVFILMLLSGNKKGKGGFIADSFNSGLDTQNKISNITFDDVAGAEEAKEIMQDLLFYLKNPEKCAKYGIKAPKGAMLYGPPGTGKTLMAKALACESGANYKAVSGSVFVDKFVGNGASRVRELFKSAKENLPCIIFIDEIDAVAGKRDSVGGNDERHQTLNELLSAMDGFDSGEGLFVVGATNRLDTLDPAIMRSGRFDTKVHIDLPDLNARKKILNVHAKNKPIAEDVDFDLVAKMTTYCSGADLENIMNKAGFYAAKEESNAICIRHIDKAINSLIAGDEKKDRSGISIKDKELTAYHEAGHALVSKILANTKVNKISIIPTTHGAGGYTMVNNEDTMYKSRKELENELCILLGGRAAEDIIYGEENVTTGASSDIRKSTQLVESMVKQYGMSKTFGLIAFKENTAMDKSIMEEVQKIINKNYQLTKDFLIQNKDKLEILVSALLEKEVLLEEEIENLI